MSLAFKAAQLAGGRVYRLRADGKLYGFTDTFTEYEFVTNLPPYGGNCTIDPHEGEVLHNEITIEIFGIN